MAVCQTNTLPLTNLKKVDFDKLISAVMYHYKKTPSENSLLLTKAKIAKSSSSSKHRK